MDKHNHVSILFYRSRVLEVAENRLSIASGPRHEVSVKLSQRDDRDLKILSGGL